MNFSDAFHDGSIVFTRTSRAAKWDVNEIRSLMFLSFGAQTILTFFGNRRKYGLRSWSRYCLWLSYLMASPVATLLLGKLSAMSITAYNVEGSDLTGYHLQMNDVYSECATLVGLWAPLLLVQICSPNIIYYSVEENKMKLRQAVGLISQVAIAFWIFYQSLFLEDAPYWVQFALYVVGIIKVGERLAALWSLSNSENGVITSFENTDIGKAEIPTEPGSSSDNPVSGTYSNDLSLLVKAYQRFDRLKPYLENWLGHPSSTYLPSMSVEFYLPKDVFRITEFELSFMYDVLYTKAPINYSKKSFWGRRIVCILILIFGLCKYKMTKSIDSVITVGGLVPGAIVLDICEMKELLYSDWAILHMIKHNGSGEFKRKWLRIVTEKIRSKKHRWSHRMDQLNLLSYCLYEDSTMIGWLIRRIPKVKGYYKEFKKYCVKKDIQVPEELKKLILEQIYEVRAQRGRQLFFKKGEWALERCNCLQEFEWSIEADFGTQADDKQTGFGKAIIMWHIATNVCYILDDGLSKGTTSCSQYEMSKVLSEYMIYLLAMHPYILSIVTGDILFHGVCSQVEEFLKTKQSKEATTLCWNLLDELDENYFEGIPKNNVLTSEWNVLHQVQKLTRMLLEKQDRWRIISSVWVEMLCYGATNCPWTLHAEQLWRGGESLTHVWLLLEHEKDQSKVLSRELIYIV